MIEWKNVTKKYGRTTVLDKVNLTIDEPGIYCLLGRNGAGKTTFLKSFAGCQNVSGGQIKVEGKRISTAVLEPGISYMENFARHFNLPVGKLLRTASEVNAEYDDSFAAEMLERFGLDRKKKFKQLSLGMKTMVSALICLSSSRPVVLLDEPVLGFDVIMRTAFYDMLRESFQRHPRIIIVSTHMIEEIAETIHKLIILDKGRIRFFDTLRAVEEKAFAVSGRKKEVEAAVAGRNVIGEDAAGEFTTSYIFDTPPKQVASLKIAPLSLQDFFIQMVGRQGGIKA